MYCMSAFDLYEPWSLSLQRRRITSINLWPLFTIFVIVLIKPYVTAKCVRTPIPQTLHLFHLGSPRLKNYTTLVGVYVNTIKTTFLFKFWFLTMLSYITFQVTKEKLSIDRQFLFSCICVSYDVWKLGRNKKFKSKVVFIVLIYATKTAFKQLT